MRNNDEFEVLVEIPPAAEMLKKAGWAYDKEQDEISGSRRRNKQSF